MAKLFAPLGLELVVELPPVVVVPFVVPLVDVLFDATGLLPGAMYVVPLTNDAANAGEYAAHVAFSARGQVSSWQIAWVAGAAVAGMAAAGLHREPKALLRAMPTAVASSLVTPKEAAERPTWVEVGELVWV